MHHAKYTTHNTYNILTSYSIASPTSLHRHRGVCGSVRDYPSTFKGPFRAPHRAQGPVEREG
ncbi:hypothetical protein EON63_24875 [archaeon]|nr:MAG: hypothetical protein EON63_24875 [archaeon]